MEKSSENFPRKVFQNAYKEYTAMEVRGVSPAEFVARAQSITESWMFRGLVFQ